MFINRDKDTEIKLHSMDHYLKPTEKKEFNELFQTDCIRALLVGATRSGKTTWIFNVLWNRQVKFSHCMIIAPRASLEQGMYESMAEMLNAPTAIELELGYDIPPVCELRDLSDIPKVEDLEEDEDHVIVIDDWVEYATSKEKAKITDLVQRGSRRRLHLFLLAQKFTGAVPTKIRDNIYSFVLFSSITVDVITEINRKYFGVLHPKEITAIFRKLVSKPFNFIMMLKLIEDKTKQFYIGEKESYVPMEELETIRNAAKNTKGKAISTTKNNSDNAEKRF